MIEFKLPSLGAEMDEGKLIQWKVKPGDPVKKGDVVAVVDTSKAAIDVEIWEPGTIHELAWEPGATVPVGTVIARLLEPGESAEHAEEEKRKREAAVAGTGAAAVPAATAAPPSRDPGPPPRQRACASRRRRASARKTSGSTSRPSPVPGRTARSCSRTSSGPRHGPRRRRTAASRCAAPSLRP